MAGSSIAAEEEKDGKIIHGVLFQLKEDVSDGEAAALVSDSYKLLAKVPSVKKLHSGGPSKKPMTRSSIDYDVALFCEFADAKGLAEYTKHPLHLEYVRKHREHWAKVEVLDVDAR